MNFWLYLYCKENKQNNPRIKIMKTPITYTVTVTRNRIGSAEYTGTVEHLVKQVFGYTLETGASYQHEKGNQKVNRNPKTIAQLLTALNRASNNAAANGYSGTHYSASIAFQEVISHLSK